MNDTELKCFIAVADTLSFTNAAKELYFSVPTVTHNIQNLESELGTDLFIRKKQSVSLTPDGHIFYLGAKAILEQENIVHMNLREGRNNSILRLGFASQMDAAHAADILERMRKEIPAIIPELYVEDYNSILRLFEMDHLDFAFGTFPVPATSHIQYQELGRDPICAVSRADGPLSKEKAIQSQVLDNLRLLIVSPRLFPYDSHHMANAYLQQHQADHSDLIVNNEIAGYSLAQAGYGVYILPASRIPDQLAQMHLCKCRIEDFEEASYGLLFSRFSNKNILTFLREQYMRLHQ